MYPLSSQRRFWTYTNEQELNDLRTKQNREYLEKHGRDIEEQEHFEYFLSPSEERILLKQYEMHMHDFCRRFEPAMPKCAIGTSFHYFKRFYLNNSPMDYHPKEILATCVYLACKVEEFNVSIGQFVNNIKGDRNKATYIILSHELLLMQHLKYHLTIHNPYRAIEGLLIDIKTRSSVVNPERLRRHIDTFMEQTYFTDVCLLFAPSQIALAAVLHAASAEQENLDLYVTKELLNGSKDKLPILIDAVRKIRLMVKQYQAPTRENFKQIEKKLEKCRNQANNPDSEEYKKRMRELSNDDDLNV